MSKKKKAAEVVTEVVAEEVMPVVLPEPVTETVVTVSSLPVLSKEVIQATAPMIYTQAPYEGTSPRYTFIPTHQVIEDMKSLGWEVCEVKKMKSRDRVQEEYGKHMVKFFNPNIFISRPDGGVEAYPQILIINNHRGWGRFRFEIGVFRLVCSNGMVVKEKDMGGFTLRHMGYSFEELKELVNKAVEELPKIVERINVLSHKEMSEAEQKAFAKKALQLRLGEEKVVEDATILQVLNPNRKEDQGTTVWKIFNRVQESVIKGGFEVANEKGVARKVRSITNMTKDVELNQKLWELVEEFA